MRTRAHTKAWGKVPEGQVLLSDGREGVGGIGVWCVWEDVHGWVSGEERVCPRE